MGEYIKVGYGGRVFGCGLYVLQNRKPLVFLILLVLNPKYNATQQLWTRVNFVICYPV